MRILILARSMGIGGAERQIAILANGLKKRGHDVRVAVFYGGGPLESELHQARIPLIDLKKAGRWDFLAFMRRLRAAVGMFSPHVVYAFLTTPNILGALVTVGSKTPIIFGIRASDFDPAAYDWAARFSIRLESWLSRLPSQIIVNSEKGREILVARGASLDRITVISNGVDTGRFHPDADARRTMRAHLRIAADELFVATVGRLDPMKDHETFVRTAALMKQTRGNLRFCIVGDGPRDIAAALRRQADALGLKDLQILASSPDVEHLYPAFDLFVLSSRFGEGFPNVIAEAMACGVPAVSTRVGDAAFIIGDELRIATPSDPAALAMVALRALAYPTDRPEERIRRLFSADAMVRSTEAVLTNLANR